MRKSILTFLLGLVAYVSFALTDGTLLVVNKGDNTVSILDLKNKVEVKRIETGNGPHEVAVSKDGKIGAVSNYGDPTPNNSLTIIDIENKKSIKEIKLGKYTRPHGIEFINNTEVLVTSETMGALIKVNTKDGTISEIATTQQKAGHMVAHAHKNRFAYVSNIASGTVSQIDLVKKSLSKNINVKAGIEGIGITPNGKEVWVANRTDSTVSVISTNDYSIKSTLKAHRVAFRVKILPNGKNAVVSNGESGNLSIYDAKQKKWIKDIDLHNVHKGEAFSREPIDPENPPIPVGIAISPDSKYVYVACANYDLVAIISTANWEVIGTVKTGPAPDGVYFSSVKQ